MPAAGCMCSACHVARGRCDEIRAFLCGPLFFFSLSSRAREDQSREKAGGLLERGESLIFFSACAVLSLFLDGIKRILPHVDAGDGFDRHS